MTASVLTIVKNRAGHLTQLVEGLRRSDAVPRELIVVDMGSDEPVSVSGTAFPNRVIRLDRRGLPLSAARNAAAGAATGDHLLFLDVDCIPMHGLVGEMTRCLVEQDALICASIRYLGPKDARSGDWTEGQLVANAHLHDVRSFPVEGLREETNSGLFWSLAFGIRRQLYLDLGGFDEAFEGYGAEDTDFGFRATRAGVPLLFKGGAGALHQHHDTFDPPLQHVADIVRNASVFHDKWGEWPMGGWLDRFRENGFVAFDGDRLSLVRLPNADEIEASRVMPPQASRPDESAFESADVGGSDPPVAPHVVRRWPTRRRSSIPTGRRRPMPSTWSA